MSLKMGMFSYTLLKPLRSKWFKPQMAWNC
jgi:hypothetical protein